HEQIKAQRAQREAYGLQLRLEFERVGEQITADDTVILEAERFYSDALANEYNAIVQYNNVLATFEFAKGTMLLHNSVSIAEGPLPACAQERAVEHHKKRTAALVLAKRKEPVHCPNGDCGKDPLALPKLPKEEAVALPSLFEGAPKAPDAPPDLQMPRKEEPGQMPQTLPPPPGPSAGVGAPRTEWAGQVAPVPPKADTSAPQPRPERFGQSNMLPPSPLTRDSAPSLMPDQFGLSPPGAGTKP